MGPGANVEVRTRFDGHWVGGFAVADVRQGPDQQIYRLRRLSDGSVLPAEFASEEVRNPAGSASTVQKPRS